MGATCCVLLWLVPAWGQGFTGVLTQHNDSARTGQNLSETVLTPQTVNSSSFGKVFSYSVDGQIYAQPLYVPNVNIPNQGTYNVVYVATENDSLYAFDADGVLSAPLWQVSFVNPAQGITTLPCQKGGNQGDLICNVYPVYGITGTPVIDAGSGTIYLVARTLENGVSFQRLHAIDITTGAEKFGGPVVIQGSVVGTGVGSKGGMVPFDPFHDIQRAGLLLLNGNVYIGWAGSAHGWIMKYDAQTLTQTAIFNTTPNAALGGVWQSGNGLAADDQGNIYAAVGDGLFDANLGGVDYGDTLLKLSPNLTVLDYFTPLEQACRKGNDLDLGSGGPIVLPAQPGTVPNETVIAGKGGSPCDLFGSQAATPIYLLNRDSLGQYNSQQDQDVETVAGSAAGYWSSSAYWQGPDSAYLYLAGIVEEDQSGDALKMYSVTNGLISSSPVAQSSNLFPTGSTPSLSANANTNGIIWAVARQDHLFTLPGNLPAVLYAYDATNVSLMLYNSAQIPERDQGGCGNKFQTPTIANGKVYVGTENELDVFGPLGDRSSLPVVFLPLPCVNLGPQVIGTTSKPKPLTLRNSGSAPLNLAGIGLTGPAAGDYTQTNNCGSSVPAGGNCTIHVTFTPSTGGVRSAFVTITDNAAGSPHNVALTGRTRLGGSLTLDPSALAFGNITVGTSSVSDPVSVTNSGQIAVNINQIGFTGKNSGDFSQTNDCPSSLPSGAGCQINVTFSPSKKGTRSAVLTLTDDALGSPQSVGASGKGVLPVVTLKPSSLTFVPRNLGHSSHMQKVTLKNVGAGSLFISSISITGTNSTDFSQTNNCGSTVLPGANCTIQTTFTPTGGGPRTAAITVTDNAANTPQNVPLQGVGNAPEVSLNPNSIDFPDQELGTSSPPTPVSVTNAGNRVLTISSITSTGDFSQTNNCGTSVPPGGNCTINVVFTPSALGLRQGQVTLTDNTPDSPQAVSLSGNGVAPAVSLAPGSLSFSNQDIFTTSPQQQVSLTNVGSATLILGSITVSGDYQQVNNCASSLPVGGSCSITVTFTPDTLGVDNGSLTVNDSAVDSPQTVPLSGTGVTSVVSFSPSSLSFPTQPLDTTSPPQNLTLTNLASAALNISSIDSSNPDFAETDDCIPSVPPGGSCTLGITFTPSQTDPEGGTITIADDAPDGPQLLSVSGNGTVPAVALSPANLSFGAQSVGTTSSPQTVTLANVGTGLMNLTTIIAINPDYTQTNNCPTSLNPGDSCAIVVTFTPTVAGFDPGTVSLTDDAPASPQQLVLSGSGTS